MVCRKLIVGLGLLLSLVGCAINPRLVADAQLCNFRKWTAEVPQPPVAPVDHNLVQIQPDESQLLISGGSQHGAFGAGFLAQWKILNKGHLPRFRLVTGVSTGAMLSTSAFLDEPESAAAAYAIHSEKDLLTPYAKLDAKGAITMGSYASIARHSALSDLGPLRALLHRLITLDMLRRVSDNSFGRQLLVGAVDVDSGDAVVFDLTEMAQRATVEQDSMRKEHSRDCYIDAIIASGSVPMAAAPVFIDNREYVDGGARFGVFADGFGQSAGLRASDGSPPTIHRAGPPPKLFLLVNGTQQLDPHCGKAIGGGGQCPGGADPYNNIAGAHQPWSLIPLAKRSSDILINQVYRFSVSDIVQRYDQAFPGLAANNVHYLPIIRPQANAFVDPQLGRTCADLRAQDDLLLRPLEFHPHYMQCLIAYGRQYASARSAVLTGQPVAALQRQ